MRFTGGLAVAVAGPLTVSEFVPRLSILSPSLAGSLSRLTILAIILLILGIPLLLSLLPLGLLVLLSPLLMLLFELLFLGLLQVLLKERKYVCEAQGIPEGFPKLRAVHIHIHGGPEG